MTNEQHVSSAPFDELVAFAQSIYLSNADHYEEYAIDGLSADGASFVHAVKVTSRASFALPDPIVPGLSDRCHAHQRQIEEIARGRCIPVDTREEFYASQG